MNEQISGFELKVLEAFCEANPLPVSNLRDQLKCLTVKSRERTGVGEYVNFENSYASRCEVSANLTGIAGMRNDGSVEVGFVLFITDGLIDILEGFSYTGNWPEDASSLRLVLA